MAEKPYRTIDARPSSDSLIKPGELVDLIEVTPLSLNDRRIYNQLLENAWDAIDKPVSHVISKAALTISLAAIAASGGMAAISAAIFIAFFAIFAASRETKRPLHAHEVK